jgi:hypothetical protein
MKKKKKNSEYLFNFLSYFAKNSLSLSHTDAKRNPQIGSVPYAVSVTT